MTFKGFRFNWFEVLRGIGPKEVCQKTRSVTEQFLLSRTWGNKLNPSCKFSLCRSKFSICRNVEMAFQADAPAWRLMTVNYTRLDVPVELNKPGGLALLKLRSKHLGGRGETFKQTLDEHAACEFGRPCRAMALRRSGWHVEVMRMENPSLLLNYFDLRGVLMFLFSTVIAAQRLIKKRCNAITIKIPQSYCCDEELRNMALMRRLASQTTTNVARRGKQDRRVLTFGSCHRQIRRMSLAFMCNLNSAAISTCMVRSACCASTGMASSCTPFSPSCSSTLCGGRCGPRCHLGGTVGRACGAACVM